MLFGFAIILIKEFVSSENVGDIFDNWLLFSDIAGILSAPFLAKSDIIPVKISVTRSSSSSDLVVSFIFSPVIVFRLKIYPRSSP